MIMNSNKLELMHNRLTDGGQACEPVNKRLSAAAVMATVRHHGPQHGCCTAQLNSLLARLGAVILGHSARARWVARLTAPSRVAFVAAVRRARAGRRRARARRRSRATAFACACAELALDADDVAEEQSNTRRRDVATVDATLVCWELGSQRRPGLARRIRCLGACTVAQLALDVADVASQQTSTLVEKWLTIDTLWVCLARPLL